MRIPCVLTIAGLDSGGGAGIVADLKTFAALGVHGLSVVTAVTAQNTQRVEGTFEIPPRFVRKQLDAVARDFDVEWAKAGMLSSADIIREVESGVKRHRLRLVVDPVMVAATGDKLLRDDALNQLKNLLERAELVTPNILEAQRLAGMRIRSARDVRNAARKISGLGPKAVLIKGGHLPRRDILDLLLVNGKFWEFRGPRIASEPVHGTGCSFSAAITAELSRGVELPEAVRDARGFIVEAIEGRLNVGKGLSPVDPLASLRYEVGASRALREVWAGAQLIVNDSMFVDLLPEVGSNLVMALPGARERSEVIGLSGRIVRAGNQPHLTGFPTRGGSEHVANIVITAMRHNQEVRAGLNVRFSEDVLKRCRELGLSVSSFDRRKEPRGVKTMRWGTEQAIKLAGRVPDVIFDRGAKGKEPMIRLLGRTATEVAERALELAKDLRR